jgi:hypothetical protein
VCTAAGHPSLLNRFDFNANGAVTANGALLIINRLSHDSLPDLSKPISTAELATFRYSHPTGDNLITANDSLNTINLLARGPSSSEQEAEITMPLSFKRIDASKPINPIRTSDNFRLVQSARSRLNVGASGMRKTKSESISWDDFVAINVHDVETKIDETLAIVASDLNQSSLT